MFWFWVSFDESREIKEKNPAELAELPAFKLRILETASQYFKKKNGTLLYSTCTVLKEENEQVVRAILRTHPDFEAIPVLPELGAPFDAPMVTLLPQFYNSDDLDAGMRHPDVIVVDPPRKGCDETLLATMIQMEPEKIVYVSCDSATLARDLSICVEMDMRLKNVSDVICFQ